jgi:hypothetical protein
MWYKPLISRSSSTNLAGCHYTARRSVFGKFEWPGSEPQSTLNKGAETMTTVTTIDSRSTAIAATRWTQLICCILCMILVANLRYGWTLFVNPINKAHGWSIASIQLAFNIFIALETWPTPIHCWIADGIGERRGPKLMVAVGGIVVAVGWIINANAQSLEMLYLGAVVGGTGGGAVYATCVGQAVKWFPDSSINGKNNFSDVGVGFHQLMSDRGFFKRKSCMNNGFQPTIF